jgi:hypothetical protein
MTRKLWTVAGAVAVLLLVGGVAVASIPDASGVIHGCRKNSDGTLRVIDSDLGQTCANGWTPLNWSQTGPQGPAGPSGVQRSISGQSVPLVAGEERRITIPCPAGQAVISGGWSQGGDNVHVYSSRPQVAPTEAWVLDVINTSANLGSLDAFAVCTVVA